MKSILGMICFVLILFAGSCGGGGGSSDQFTPEEGKKSLVLKADKLTCLSDNKDSVVLTAILYDEKGVAVENSDIDYYMNGSSMNSNVFRTSTPGTYTFSAKCDDLESNSVSVKAKKLQTFTKISIKPSCGVVEADGDDKVSFDVSFLDQDGDPMYGKTAEIYQNGVLMTKEKFSSKKKGVFSFTAKCDGLSSDAVKVKAINFFDLDTLRNIEIVISKSEWDGMTQDMLEYEKKFPDHYYLCKWRTENYRKAKVVLRDADGDFEIDEVGIRTKGNTSRMLPQDEDGLFHRAAFKLKFDKAFNDLVKGTDEYDRRKKRTFLNMSELNLKTYDVRNIEFRGGKEYIHYDWNNPMRINALYSYRKLNEAGIWAPRSNSVDLVIRIKDYDSKGDKVLDYGIYFGLEEVDKKFISKRMNFVKNANDGDLYKCLYQQGGPATLESLSTEDNNVLKERGIIGKKDAAVDYRPTYDIATNEDETDHHALKDFIRNLNDLTGDAFVSYMDANFDVDMFMKSLAWEVLLGNPDGYFGNAQNYYLYFPPAGTGYKITFIPCDLDHSVGAGWYPTDMTHVDIYKYYQAFNSSDDVSTHHSLPLVEKLLNVPKYMKMYTDYLASFTDATGGTFNYADFEKFFNACYSLYTSDVDHFKCDVELHRSWFDESGNLVPETRTDKKDYMYPCCIEPFNGLLPSWADKGKTLTVEDYFNEKIGSVRTQLGLK